MRTPQFGVTQQPLDYLVNRLAGRPVPLDAIACVAMEEILAEKIISFLRRYAQHQAGAMAQQWDETLVRYMYDVYCISLSDSLVGQRAASGFKRLVDFDVMAFGGQFESFEHNPAATLRSALDQAAQDVQIRGHTQKS